MTGLLIIDGVGPVNTLAEKNFDESDLGVELPESFRDSIVKILGVALSEAFVYFSDYDEVGAVELDEIGFDDAGYFDDGENSISLYNRDGVVALYVDGGDVIFYFLNKSL